jgi:hypothetical protein
MHDTRTFEEIAKEYVDQYLAEHNAPPRHRRLRKNWPDCNLATS